MEIDYQEFILQLGSLQLNKPMKEAVTKILDNCINESVPIEKLDRQGIPQPVQTVENDVVEKCALHIEKLADGINEIVFADRHILQDDTTELLRIEKEIRRNCAIELRKLKR